MTASVGGADMPVVVTLLNRRSAHACGSRVCACALC
jgi:NAD/NADP transhydrogenase beta subunit